MYGYRFMFYWNEETGEVPSKYSEDKKKIPGLPGGHSVDKNLLSQCREDGFDPWSGRFYTRGQSKPAVGLTNEAHLSLEPVLCKKSSHCNEQPRLPQLKKASAKHQDPEELKICLNK